MLWGPVYGEVPYFGVGNCYFCVELQSPKTIAVSCQESDQPTLRFFCLAVTLDDSKTMAEHSSVVLELYEWSKIFVEV
jgi:hypothetical protein